MPDSSYPNHGEADGEAVWKRALGVLRTLVDSQVYHLRISGTLPLDWDPKSNRWTLGVRDELSVDWLANSLARQVATALTYQTPDLPPPQLEFVVYTAATEHRPARRPQAMERSRDREELDSTTRAPEPRMQDAARTGGSRDQAGAARRVRQEFGPLNYYSRILHAFRREALCRLKGVKVSVFLCVALHAGSDHVATITLEQIMGGTGYCRAAVCSALLELCSPRFRLLERLPRTGRGPNRLRVLGYIYFGSDPLPAIYELVEEGFSS